MRSQRCWNCKSQNLYPDQDGDVRCLTCGRYQRGVDVPNLLAANELFRRRMRAVVHMMTYEGLDMRFMATDLDVELTAPRGENRLSRWIIRCPMCGKEASASLWGHEEAEERRWRFECGGGHVVLAKGSIEGIPERWQLTEPCTEAVDVQAS